MALLGGRRRRRLLTAGLGVVVSILLLWWTLHDVSFIQVVRHAQAARVSLLLAGLGLTLLTLPLRAVRWRILLTADDSRPGLGALWYATAIGFMANNVLPARTGELARAYAATRLTAVRFATSVASVAIERVFDGLTVIGMIVLALVGGGVGSRIGGVDIARLAGVVGGVLALLLAGAATAAVWPARFTRVYDVVAPMILPRRWAEAVGRGVAGFLSGFQALRSGGQFAGTVVMSVVIWGTQVAGYAFGLAAFDIEVPWRATILLTGLVALGIAVPSSPGFFGPFEAVTRATLAVFAIETGRAVSFAVTFHLTTFLGIALLGLWCMSRAHLHLAELSGQSALQAGSVSGPEPDPGRRMEESRSTPQ